MGLALPCLVASRRTVAFAVAIAPIDGIGILIVALCIHVTGPRALGIVAIPVFELDLGALSGVTPVYGIGVVVIALAIFLAQITALTLRLLGAVALALDTDPDITAHPL